ncbi:MAG: aminoacyl-tRNA hydrolase [Ignavibacteria bacterium]|nr:aminoacyl-tRNA hydrolase [Ignavibacteria bacterium]MCU7498935.1 aminoacyl-tRNA hydrolase [Ignavibacteria bacterium]MCU7513327.1 aminoacyl-tRNA hydrolase [Ignavibacteria bacterium]MCU7521381.1 aminoacyl-tRNA hydrolase [Ignavibacteria bacterium]MCU7524172.1 aminoacyl-tRNA hydrolase [Ignavibacteria bacterium]
MRAIFAIGNPGSRYEKTRHNVGVMLLDYFAQKFDLSFKASKKSYYFAEGELNGSPFILIRPSTYVNLSGIAASDFISEHKLELEDFLVLYDDLNLSLAQLKVKLSGGDGGHNGISSVIYHLASDKFPRLRIGIGRNFSQGQMADYVLSTFSEEEFKALEPAFMTGSMMLEEYVKGGVKNMLDFYSIRRQSADPEGKDSEKENDAQ